MINLSQMPRLATAEEIESLRGEECQVRETERLIEGNPTEEPSEGYW